MAHQLALPGTCYTACVQSVADEVTRATGYRYGPQNCKATLGFLLICVDFSKGTIAQSSGAPRAPLSTLAVRLSRPVGFYSHLNFISFAPFPLFLLGL